MAGTRKLRKYPLSRKSTEYQSLQKLFVNIRGQIGFRVCRYDICNRPVYSFVCRSCQKGVDVARVRLPSDGQRKPFSSPRPRACLGLFAAAETLGLGFVHGVQPCLYLERMSQDIVESLGLSEKGADQQADIYVRIPGNRESVFRGAVVKEGVPSSDILQVWLDVSQHPSRGKEQADLIWRRVLAPVFEAKESW
jgi:hypothetical protein